MIRSGRAKRMQQHHKRHPTTASLNLVSLMDIFTILVFFLLVNSSDVQILPNAKSLHMPESVAEQKPRETIVVQVTADSILVQGVPVATVSEALADEAGEIGPLRRALEAVGNRRILSADEEIVHEVTIMGDREIPFQLLRKVMATCTQAEFGRISLAVMQAAAEAGA